MHRAGQNAARQSDAPEGRYAVVFEDDGDTGYLYGLDSVAQEVTSEPIVDALHLYTVANVVDRETAYPVEIRWAKDRNRVGLFIAERCQAVFDFDQKRAVCRSGFPPATGAFTSSHEWDDTLTSGL